MMMQPTLLTMVHEIEQRERRIDAEQRRQRRLARQHPRHSRRGTACS
jgi:hypothetical protein